MCIRDRSVIGPEKGDAIQLFKEYVTDFLWQKTINEPNVCQCNRNPCENIQLATATTEKRERARSSPVDRSTYYRHTGIAPMYDRWYFVPGVPGIIMHEHDNRSLSVEHLVYRSVCRVQSRQTRAPAASSRLGRDTGTGTSENQS